MTRHKPLRTAAPASNMPAAGVKMCYIHTYFTDHTLLCVSVFHVWVLVSFACTTIDRCFHVFYFCFFDINLCVSIQVQANPEKAMEQVLAMVSK